MTKVIVAFRNFVNVPKKNQSVHAVYGTKSLIVLMYAKHLNVLLLAGRGIL